MVGLTVTVPPLGQAGSMLCTIPMVLSRMLQLRMVPDRVPPPLVIGIKVHAVLCIMDHTSPTTAGAASADDNPTPVAVRLLGRIRGEIDGCLGCAFRNQGAIHVHSLLPVK